MIATLSDLPESQLKGPVVFTLKGMAKVVLRSSFVLHPSFLVASACVLLFCHTYVCACFGSLVNFRLALFSLVSTCSVCSCKPSQARVLAS